MWTEINSVYVWPVTEILTHVHVHVHTHTIVIGEAWDFSNRGKKKRKVIDSISDCPSVFLVLFIMVLKKR